MIGQDLEVYGGGGAGFRCVSDDLVPRSLKTDKHKEGSKTSLPP